MKVLHPTVAGIFAQQSTDNTGQTVGRIIVGLLVVAFLLGALTVWYWFHTDPAKRERRPVPASVESYRDQPEASMASSASTPPEMRTNAELLEEDDADDWLRLTGPQALHES